MGVGDWKDKEEEEQAYIAVGAVRWVEQLRKREIVRLGYTQL